MPAPENNNTNNNNKDEEEFPLEEEDAEVPIDPLLSLLYARHCLTTHASTEEEREEAKQFILQEMLTHNMAPYMRMLSAFFDWVPSDEAQLAAMDATNAKRIAELDARLNDAVDNLGDTEVRDVLEAKCSHYARIGDLDACLAANAECAEKTLAAGPRLDLCFQRIRLGIAFGDNEVAAKGISDAHRLMKNGDWERRNRLKVYEGIYRVYIRDFKRGSELLLDSITTFASGELLSFRDFIFVTCIASLPVLPRQQLKQRIVDSPEVISADVSDMYGLITAIHGCRYGEVFPALDAVCQHQRRVTYVSPHVNYFFREARVLVFTQFLDSYSSVTLQSMGHAFNIPVPVLDQMLGTLISNERIASKVDRVSNSVTTYRGDSANFDYHRIIRNGDLLLNRIQKLSRLVEM